MVHDGSDTDWLVRPFAAIRAKNDFAADVISPPYDVIGLDQARQVVKDNPKSFLRVSRAEVDFADDVDAYSKVVYAKAAENYSSLLEKGILIAEREPSYYVWRMLKGEKTFTGIAGGFSVDAYQDGLVKKHELTRPKKEQDRAKHIEVLGAQTGPVMLAHRRNDRIENIVAQVVKTKTIVEVGDSEGVTHKVWKVSEEHLIQQISSTFRELSVLYIADGHHRSAAAAIVAKASCKSAKNRSKKCFLGVAFPFNQLQILPYNRVVCDLNGYTPRIFLKKASKYFFITSKQQPVLPKKPKTFGFYVANSWYEFSLKPQINLGSDKEDNLDVNILSKYLLNPILDIHDIRNDDRIDFVGGTRGAVGLTKRVDSGEMACGFSLFPTKIEDLIAVADANRIMPPKSTWFEPKLVDGLLSLATAYNE